MKKIKFLSLFTGIGSPEQALKNIGVDYELYAFCEIDKFAIESYCSIHNVNKELNLGDITEIEINKLDTDIDLITHGSPCQDFSVGGAGRGGDVGAGTRSSLMWNTVAICEHCKPKYVVWENVKNVLSVKHKHNFDRYLEEMDRIGYNNYYKVLNSKDFGVPQNRERVFVVSIRKDIDKKFIFPEGVKKPIILKDFLDNDVDPKYYVNEEKTKQLLINLNDTIDLNKQVIGTCHKHNDLARSTRERVYNELMLCPTITATIYKDAPKILVGRLAGMFDDEKGKHQAGSIYDVNGLSPTLDTMQGGYRQPCIVVKQPTKKGFDIAYEGDSINLENATSTTRRGRVGKQIVNTLNTGNHNCVVQNFRIRKLTPNECYRLMGFKNEQFNLAAKVCSNTQLYKQAGNSIVVDVMAAILKNIFKDNE